MTDRADILSLELEDLKSVLAGFPDYRAYTAKQVFEWLHVKKVSDFSEMSNVSAQTRELFDKNFCIKSLKAVKSLVSSRQDTVKYLYGLDDGNRIETVAMSHRHGNSLCISSQVGCRMGCKFCASGLNGLVRNLTPSEMLLQLYRTPRKTDSIVIMGVGEPLDNFGNVIGFLRLLQSGHGMSLRHVSLSTCGLADKIDELAELKLGLTLSVSLHAADDVSRSEIMPVNRKFGLERLLCSCKAYFEKTGRRISFEYALISGVNDGEEHARRLAGLLLSGIPKGACHVNLIPVNEVSETGFKKSGNSKTFSAVLEKSGITATTRRTMGGDINAACGQLRTMNNE